MNAIMAKVKRVGREQPMVCIQSTTERRSVEVTNPDGSVTKTAVFQHVQWRPMF